MQETRRHILESLKQRGQATVDELVIDLRQRRGDQITAVTVRHHLTRLEEDGLITQAAPRPRTTPGARSTITHSPNWAAMLFQTTTSVSPPRSSRSWSKRCPRRASM